MRRATSLHLLLAVAALVFGGAARALVPLEEFRYEHAGREVAVRVPSDWAVTPGDAGLTMQRDPSCDLFGSARLEFATFAGAAPTPEAFLDAALARWGADFADWQVLERAGDTERPRVRTARVRFRRLGFVCTGVAQAVSGERSGTLGFAYAEAVTAARLELAELVPLLVAGTFDPFPVRAVGADPSAKEARDAALERLYGDAAGDLKQVLTELDQNGALDYSLLDRAAFFQPLLRSLKNLLTEYLTTREQDRILQAEIYCLPGHEFNAFALGRNNLGPGLLAFYAGMCDPFARVAEQYCALRERGLDAAAIGDSLAGYHGRLAQAVLRQEPLPEPEAINWADPAQVDRFVKVFYSIMGTVLAHEMAHYYMRHSESGQTDDPHSVQQREVAADAAAVRHLQRVADETDAFWEGGIYHCFAFFTVLDQVLQQAAGAQVKPEYMSTHPFGETRLNMARASVGGDNLRMRHDPWVGGEGDDEAGGTVEIVGRAPGGAPAPGAVGGVFTHPVSGVALPIPPGWTGGFDPASGLLTLHRAGQEGRPPLLCYTTGGAYPGPRAVCEDILSGLRGGAPDLRVVASEALATGVPGLEGYAVAAEATLFGAPGRAVAIGLVRGGQAHGLLLVTGQPERDEPVLRQLAAGLRFP